VRLDVDGRVQQERQVRRGGLSGFSADAERKRGRRWGPTQHVVKEMEEGGGSNVGSHDMAGRGRGGGRRVAQHCHSVRRQGWCVGRTWRMWAGGFGLT
jgi:hypothetical protein